LTGLTGILGQLAGAAQNGSEAPDASVQTGFAKAKVMAEAELAKWNQLKTTDLAELNRQLRQANLAPISLGGGAL
jgi:hypothetical protein